MDPGLPNTLGIYILNLPLARATRFEHRYNPICNFDRMITQLINQESCVNRTISPKCYLKQ